MGMRGTLRDSDPKCSGLIHSGNDAIDVKRIGIAVVPGILEKDKENLRHLRWHRRTKSQPLDLTETRNTVIRERLTLHQRSRVGRRRWREPSSTW